ncbi:phage tail protein [bacterium]|nr:MAG: phage tail protein [bacterium]
MSSAGSIYGRSLSFPPRVGPDGRMAWSEGAENIRESIRVILLTEFRERVRLPDFGCGLNAFLFEPNTVAVRHLIEERIAQALKRWEPRIAVESARVEEDPADREAAIATIQYKLVATQTRERISLGVRLSG